MTHRDSNPGEIEAARRATLRAERAPRVVCALQDARSALNMSGLRHEDRFMQDLSVMIDAIEAQRHE